MSIDDSFREHASKWNVSGAIHQEDFIFRFLLEHPLCSSPDQAAKDYFDTGRKSAELLGSILKDDLSIDVTAKQSLLEFACGYGAVTRHLYSLFPAFDITSSDIHQEANNFIATELGGRAILSSCDPESFDSAGKYDFVFALSFFFPHAQVHLVSVD